MAKIIGRLKNVGIGLEVVRGAGVAPSFWLPKTSISIEDKVMKARDTSSFGVLNVEGNQAIPTKKWAEGDLEFDLYSNSFGVFLKALLGSVSSGSVVDSSYIHTFSIDDINQHPSMAISCEDGGISEYMFKLAMINSMTIEIEPEAVVKVSVNFMSKQSVATTQTATYLADSKFVGRHLTFKIENLVGDLTSGQHIPIKKLTLNFEKNTRLDHNLGTVEPEDIQNQSLRITGEVEVDYENRNYRDLMMNGTYKAVRIQLENTEAVIGGGTSTPRFILDLARVDFEEWEAEYPNDEIASQSFTFTALHDLTTGKTINSCTLRNGTVSY